jgi:hypothetical protein
VERLEEYGSLTGTEMVFLRIMLLICEKARDTGGTKSSAGTLFFWYK